MVIRYQFLPEYQLLIQKYSGEWDLKEYHDYYDHIMQFSQFHKTRKVLTDLNEIDLTKSYKQMQELVNFREDIIKTNYFNVHLINNSMNTAFVHLYQSQLREMGYEYEYCCTHEKALMLLGLPFSSVELQIMIDDLENAYNFRKKAN